MIKPHIYFILSINLLCFPVLSQKIKKDSLKFKAGILPTAFYTPETSLGMGGLIYTYLKPQNGNAAKISNSQTYFSFTFNRQFSIENDYQIWLKKKRYFFFGSADYTRFPELFFGRGNQTQVSNPVIFCYDMIRINSHHLKNIRKNFYAGIILNFQKLFNTLTNQGIRDDCTIISGFYGIAGYTSAGAGFELLFDNRNNPLNPSKGHYIQISFTDYTTPSLNQYKFVSFKLDVRKYHTLSNILTWNGNIFVSYQKGQVPYKMLSELGGPRFLRGYYRGRFRDNNMLVMQNEFRMPVYKFIGFAMFGGIGKVSDKPHTVNVKDFHYNYGVGLRLRIDKNNNSNIRVDYGFTKDSKGLYIVYAEAF